MGFIFSYVKNGQNALKSDGKTMMNECHLEINIFLLITSLFDLGYPF